MLPPFPPSIIARILAYNVESTIDVANLHLLDKEAVALLPALVAPSTHFIQVPGPRIGFESFVSQFIEADDGDFDRCNVTKGEIWHIRDTALPLSHALFEGAVIKRIHFLAAPRNSHKRHKKSNSRSSVPMQATIDPISDQHMLPKVLTLCRALDSVRTKDELLQVYNEASLTGLMDPITKSISTGDVEVGENDEATGENSYEFSLKLSMCLSTTSQCIKKTVESDQATFLYLQAKDVTDESSIFQCREADRGCLFRALVVDMSVNHYTVEVLIEMSANLDDFINTTYDLRDRSSVETLVYTQVWDRFQDLRKIEGVAIVDRPVGEEFRRLLHHQVNMVARGQEVAGCVDYHPHSKNVVRDILHPALYCYIKDVSPLRASLGGVGACIFPNVGNAPRDEVEARRVDFWGRPYESSVYQWLPTYFDISRTGQCVIEDYINNLVPRESHTDLYYSLSTLFEQALPYIESVYSYIRSVRPSIRDLDEIDINYDQMGLRRLDMEYVNLRGQKLQVITKIVDYELHPGQSHDGVWHVEGMSHEEIVLTCLYILDRDEAIEGGELEFKRAFYREEAEYIFSSVSQIRHPNMNLIVDTGLQPLGTVETLPGRLIVFPNSHVHRVKPMRNSIHNSNDEAAAVCKRRIVVFFLVNPLKRIISTREVAPQQVSAGGSMKLEDAMVHRLELMNERKYTKQDWNVRHIELCEH